MAGLDVFLVGKTGGGTDMTCAWTEPLGTVIWCDDGECVHNYIGMCAMDTVDLISNKCKTKETKKEDK